MPGAARHLMSVAGLAVPILACIHEDTDSDVRVCKPGHVIWKAEPGQRDSEGQYSYSLPSGLASQCPGAPLAAPRSCSLGSFTATTSPGSIHGQDLAWVITWGVR